MKKCKHCGSKFQPYSTLQKFCSAKCMKLGEGYKKIKKISDKRQEENKIYSQLRKVFLLNPKNKFCPVFKHMKGVDIRTTEIHHTYSGKDRAKYYLDTTTWIPISREGHMWLHNNPKEARELGFLK